MRLTTIFYLLLVFISCRQEVKTPPTVDTEKERVGSMTSLLKLIATPEKYHDKIVSVTGYLNVQFEGDALYLHKEDYDKHLHANSMWLRLTERQIKEVDSLKLNRRYVLIEGTVSKYCCGHGDMFSGEIETLLE
jgi:hypothetical protein